MTDATRRDLQRQLQAEPTNLQAAAALRAHDVRTGARIDFPPRRRLRAGERPRDLWCPICGGWTLRRPSQKERARIGKMEATDDPFRRGPRAWATFSWLVTYQKVPSRLCVARSLDGTAQIVPRALPTRICTGTLPSEPRAPQAPSRHLVTVGPLQCPHGVERTIYAWDPNNPPSVCLCCRNPLPEQGLCEGCGPGVPILNRSFIAPRGGRDVTIYGEPIVLNASETFEVQHAWPGSYNTSVLDGVITRGRRCPGPARGQSCAIPLAVLEDRFRVLSLALASGWEGDREISWFQHRIKIERQKLVRAGLRAPDPPLPHECMQRDMDYVPGDRSMVRCGVCGKERRA